MPVDHDLASHNISFNVTAGAPLIARRVLAVWVDAVHSGRSALDTQGEVITPRASRFAALGSRWNMSNGFNVPQGEFCAGAPIVEPTKDVNYHVIWNAFHELGNRLQSKLGVGAGATAGTLMTTESIQEVTFNPSRRGVQIHDEVRYTSIPRRRRFSGYEAESGFNWAVLVGNCFLKGLIQLPRAMSDCGQPYTKVVWVTLRHNTIISRIDVRENTDDPTPNEAGSSTLYIREFRPSWHPSAKKGTPS